MRNLNSATGRAHRRAPTSQRRFAWVGLITILTLLLSFFPQVVPGAPVPTASAHNLNASAVYVYFDPNTQAYLDGLIATGQRPVGQPLLRGGVNGDELGIIIKAMPDVGTTTGVGGYTTFYVPNGVQVIDAAYIMPGDLIADGITGFDKVPMKGQAQMPIVGAGGDPTVSLVGITPRSQHPGRDQPDRHRCQHQPGHAARRVRRHRHLLFHRAGDRLRHLHRRQDHQ